MTATPSIKGSAFSNIAESVLNLGSAGRICRDELAKSLLPGKLDVIEGRIDPTGWHDILFHVRLHEVLEAVAGARAVQEAGENSAERLLEGGLYQQLSYLSRTRFSQVRDPARRLDAFASDLRLIVSLSGAIFNFSSWRVKPDPDWSDRCLIEVTDAGPFREIHLTSIAAFISRVSPARRASGNLRRWERGESSRLLFRMTENVAVL